MTNGTKDNPPQKKEFSSVLRVKADPPGLPEVERKRRAKALAGAIAHGLRQFGEVEVRCMGADSTLKGAKCIAIASGFVAAHGFDLYCRPAFDVAKDSEDSKEMTVICFFVVTNKTEQDSKPESGE